MNAVCASRACGELARRDHVELDPILHREPGGTSRILRDADELAGEALATGARA